MKVSAKLALLGVFLLTVLLVMPSLGFAQDLPEKDGDVELFTTDDEREVSEEVENAEEDSNDAQRQGMFEVVSEIGTQKVFGGAIPLTIHILPKIDSSKAEVLWDVPRGLTTGDETDRWFTMVEDSPRSFTIDVLPSKSGRYVVVVDVTAWRYDTNYVASVEFDFVIDNDLHVTPAQPEYVRNRTIYSIGMIVGGALAAGLLVIGVKFGIRKYRSWMAAD